MPADEKRIDTLIQYALLLAGTELISALQATLSQYPLTETSGRYANFAASRKTYRPWRGG